VRGRTTEGVLPRSLDHALSGRPLLFEPVPPSVRADPVRAGLHIEALTKLLREVPRLDAVNVPELVDENHDGRPYYRTGDPRTFARTVSQQAGCDVIVNKVVAHLGSAEAVSGWARETLAAGLRHVVLVGGSSRYIPYPGPTVAEADRICSDLLASAGGQLGNIAIPQRKGEAHRMLAKTRAGATFFTTQILFDPGAALATLREYSALAKAEGVRPGAVLLSVAPITDEADCEFVRWLGAEIPEEAERAILNEGDGGAAVRAIRLALDVWAEVRRVAEEEAWALSLGVNVEQISQRHLHSAAEMLRAFARAID
jgi:5,10-methylenetetrahydrofolate reductase